MNGEAQDRPEIWLRGNVRPVMGAAGLAAAVATTAVVWGAAAGRPAWVAAGLAAGVFTLVVLTAVGRVAARPRLARRGDVLEIRLTPGRVERVPLEVVECVFRGTEPLNAADPQPRFRVGTLVVRFAERASEWRGRDTFGPWGNWQDGHAVIDGRWCEPLSRATVERIAAALVAAKRVAVCGEARS